MHNAEHANALVESDLKTLSLKQPSYQILFLRTMSSKDMEFCSRNDSD